MWAANRNCCDQDVDSGGIACLKVLVCLTSEQYFTADLPIAEGGHADRCPALSTVPFFHACSAKQDAKRGAIDPGKARPIGKGYKAASAAVEGDDDVPPVLLRRSAPINWTSAATSLSLQPAEAMKTSAAAGTIVLAVASGLAAAQNSTTSAVPTVTATPTTAACALVSSAWAAQTAATATPTIEASVAYDCLNSVPLAKEAAIKFIDEIVPYLEWQSDTAFKKNPPADYFYPGYDLWAALYDIRDGLEAGAYTNEYSWQADLYNNVFGPGHDGHFVVYTDLLTTVIEWGRQLALVSISEDGVSLPVIKVYSDVVSSPETASVVTLINGLDAVTYLENWVFRVSSNQDADSAYNSLFFSKAYNQSGTQGYFMQSGRVRYVYPEAETSLTFANGTEITFSNLGRIKGNWAGVTDGPSFFTKFVSGAIGVSTSTATSTAGTTTTTSTATVVTTTTATATSTASPDTAALPGYPGDPVVISSDQIVSGYFLDGEGFEDVGVLVMTSFSPSDPPEFQSIVQQFFAAAVDAGIKKLVIDVQTNGGGYIFQGYDTFRQLFPDIVQNGTGRWRHSSGFNAVAEVFSAACDNYDPLTASEDLIYTCESVWNWRYDLDVNDNNFKSFDDKFGPVTFNGDNYTDVMQWNFSNPIDTINSTFGIGYDVTGYGSRQNFTRPFGGPENIVLLLDGYCASTCTLFSQFLKWDAGVKSIAMGGRPTAGAIQGVGGVKGSQSFSFSSIYSEVDLARDQTNDTDLLAEFDRYQDYVFDRAPTLSLNVKDEILPQNLDDGTPAQYVAEYADCRLYWTADMHADITNLWKAAAASAFNGSPCAFGGFNGTVATRRSATTSRPAPFNKPRYTLPKKRESVVSIVKSLLPAREKAQQFIKAQQHMVVIN
ncbi:peptidase s41 family protein [Seiridium cupressi]